MLQVQLKPGVAGGQWACLRPLCGHDEAGIQGTGLVDATQFLDRLLLNSPGTCVGPGKIGDLAVCDCDRLFAALYTRYFGDRIESTLPCQACQESFELGFDLDSLLAQLDAPTDSSVNGPDAAGLYRLPDGRRFRLPTIADQHSVIGYPVDQAVATLLQRCLVEGDLGQDLEPLETAMDQVGGVLNLDIEATCPHCDRRQTVQFNLQSYLLQMLIQEQRFLHREIHHIARAYGWSYQEILTLPREDRRAFVRLIQSEVERRRSR
ncbi:hypothetical protein [Lyngbya confervoides]|uniref:T4 bacteriophage base plate protein n=1 Tax=Lyngbya confervoides BDU141951 TaxID=1574623 RepID=A0ABD4T3K0_9CYAN|nr:hypothetical protein [Lyngbya confervoides]MCM1983259.1 hypothetical protein [Lyngbya confervoides BDU141951]